MATCFIIVKNALRRSAVDAGPSAQVSQSGDTAYLRKVAAAGGFPAYEKAHRQVFATKFAAKAFPRLPTDVAAHFVAFAFHVGYY